MKNFISLLLVVALVFSFSFSVFGANEQPSGSGYSAPQSYSSTVISTKDFWTALTNAATGIFYKLGSTSQSGSVLYILNNLYTKLGSTSSSGTIIGLLNDIKTNTASIGGGSSVSSAWTSSQATNVTNNTTLIKSTLDNIYSSLSSISSHQSAWTSSDVSSVITKLTNISSMSNILDNIAEYTQTSKLKLTDIASWESYLQSINANSVTIKNNTLNLDSKLSDIVTNTSDTAGNTFNIMERLHYLDSAAWNEGGVGFSPDSWWYNMYLRLFGTYIEALGIHEDTTGIHVDTTGIHEDTTAILPHTESIDTHTQNIDTTTTNLYDLVTHKGNFGLIHLYLPRQRPNGIQHWKFEYNIQPMVRRFINDTWSFESVNGVEDIMQYMHLFTYDFMSLSSMLFSVDGVYSSSLTDYNSGSTSTKVVGSLGDFFQTYGFSISDGVSRLSYMLADDDDIALKHAQANNIDAVHSDFLTGNDSSTSIGVGSLGTVKGIGDSMQSIFSVGSVNPSSFLGILSASDAWAFFSNQTKTDIGMNGSQRRAAKVSAFSDLDSTRSSVEVTNYYQQNISSLHDYLEVMSDG